MFYFCFASFAVPKFTALYPGGLGSMLGPKVGYPDFIRSFPQSFKANAECRDSKQGIAFSRIFVNLSVTAILTFDGL
jgi:hypothetical protein